MTTQLAMSAAFPAWASRAIPEQFTDVNNHAVTYADRAFSHADGSEFTSGTVSYVDGNGQLNTFAVWRDGKMIDPYGWDFSFYQSTQQGYSSVQIQAARDRFEQIYAQVEAYAPEGATGSDLTRARLDYACDLIGKELTYNFNGARDIVGLLGSKQTQCVGYSILYMTIAKRMGLEAGVMYGDSLGANHAWNYVKIDGVTYYTDCTYNDSMRTTKYNLLTKEAMARDHTFYN
jgi:transglutaminase-like putative cysteine protease